MRIESGTTGEYQVRSLLFLAMLVAFGLWFGYDGLWGYPSKNLNWARQFMSEKSEDLETNWKVLTKNLARVKEGMTLEEVEALLGEPALVTADEKEYWYVGPAAYGRLEIDNQRVEAVEFKENLEPNEGDIQGQKGFAVALLLISGVFAVRFAWVAGRSTILDDEGVSVRGRRVLWNQMTGLDTSDYERKGWLDLVYDASGSKRQVRLDSYHIAKFDEMVNEICTRKNFESPIKPSEIVGDETPDDVSS